VGGNLVIDFGSTGGSSLRTLPGSLYSSTPGAGEGSEITILVSAESDGEAPKGEPPPDPNESPGPTRWALELVVTCYGAPPQCTDPVAEVAGAALGTQLAPLSMQANVSGTTLTLGHLDYYLQSGMVSVIPAL
jgi:hypothetical protein